ncbi:hypothetical protein CHUAL_000122 [Chamberlinius hualienensis]
MITEAKNDGDETLLRVEIFALRDELENAVMRLNCNSLKKVEDQLMSLVGHQNQNQKIHYITKLREELYKTKEENQKLCSEIVELRNARASFSARKFDPYKIPCYCAK